MKFLIPSGDLPARDLPDASVPATTRLVAGTEVTATERRGVWVLVAVPDGRRLWVDGRRLLPADTGQEVSTAVVPPPLPPGPVPEGVPASAQSSPPSGTPLPGGVPPSSPAVGAKPRRGVLPKPWLFAVAAIALLAVATSVVLMMRPDEPDATAAATSTLPTTTTIGTTTSTNPTITAEVTTTIAGTTTSTLPAILGTGSADDPFRLPYVETFALPVDDEWIELEPLEGAALGEWTWEVVAGRLVATGSNSTVTAPRMPWLPAFELAGADAIEVRIEVVRSAGGAACGVGLVTGNDRVMGFVVDPVDRHYLIWAPVTIGDEPPWTSETSIRTGTNEVAVLFNGPESAENDVLSLYVNGEKVIDVTGWYEPLGPVTGVAPMAVVAPGDAVGECWFDAFALTRQSGGP